MMDAVTLANDVNERSSDELFVTAEVCETVGDSVPVRLEVGVIVCDALTEAVLDKLDETVELQVIDAVAEELSVALGVSDDVLEAVAEAMVADGDTHVSSRCTCTVANAPPSSATV